MASIVRYRWKVMVAPCAKNWFHNRTTSRGSNFGFSLQLSIAGSAAGAGAWPHTLSRRDMAATVATSECDTWPGLPLIAGSRRYRASETDDRTFTCGGDAVAGQG